MKSYFRSSTSAFQWACQQQLLQTEETKGWLTALDVDRRNTHVGGDWMCTDGKIAAILCVCIVSAAYEVLSFPLPHLNFTSRVLLFLFEHEGTEALRLGVSQCKLSQQAKGKAQICLTWGTVPFHLQEPSCRANGTFCMLQDAKVTDIQG